MTFLAIVAKRMSPTRWSESLPLVGARTAVEVEFRCATLERRPQRREPTRHGFPGIAISLVQHGKAVSRPFERFSTLFVFCVDPLHRFSFTNSAPPS